MEFAGYDPSLNRKRLDALTRAAVGYLRGFKAEGIEEEWCGFRPMTYDGLPIIDRSTRLTNVMIAAGHNMVGLSMGPGTGKLVAEMLNNDPPHIDPRPYRADRFVY
jgi:D-amino-acid dehydrogenase